MNKDIIVQFVCFTSNLEREEFMGMWEPYAKQLVDDPASTLLQEGDSEETGNRFKYVSMHISGTPDFRFAFMKERSKTHFPEHKGGIKQAGGYLRVQLQSAQNNIKDDTRVMAFVSHGETELDFYRGQSFHYLNIYEAYFENCAYSYVLEFFVRKQEASLLLAQLKARPGVDAGFYKECRASHFSKKVSGSLL